MTPATNGDEGSASLPTGSQRGLAEADAQRRLKLDGYNELPRSARRSPARILLEVVREPMLASLLVAGLIYLALGDTREAVILLVFATMSVSITVVQESRTERVLEALRDHAAPRYVISHGRLVDVDAMRALVQPPRLPDI